MEHYYYIQWSLGMRLWDQKSSYWVRLGFLYKWSKDQGFSSSVSGKEPICQGRGH